MQLESRLSEAQKEDLKRIVSEFGEVSYDRAGKMILTEHTIELTCEEPVRSKLYRCSPVQKQFTADEIQ